MRRLRRDFGPLGIKVEQVTGGIEIDSFEEALLEKDQGFDVLVSTPEKLGLIIRNSKMAHRPLALVVLDEAHNIEDEQRGLRIELLLATIRQDCPGAHYLLLMPFVPEGVTLARWLDPQAGRSISLGTTAWQPNERVVGLYSMWKSEEKVGRREKWGLNFDTLTTSPRTIPLRGNHKVGEAFPLDLTAYKAKTLTNLTAAMAKTFSSGGRTSIAVADSPATAWKMAQVAAESMETPDRLPDEIKLVQGFLQSEVGKDFELVSLLKKKINVHYSCLPDEARSLIEWLAEEGHLRVLCATTTIAQGINFPVASIFLQRVEHSFRTAPIPMSPREFWNLAGRAGRVAQDSVGVVGIATNGDEKTLKLKEFVGRATAALASRLVGLIEKIVDCSPEAQLTAVVKNGEWADFRSFVAHLLREAENLEHLVNQTGNILRGTLGYSVMKGRVDRRSQQQAETLISLTNRYAQEISKDRRILVFADSTGFDHTGVKASHRGEGSIGWIEGVGDEAEALRLVSGVIVWCGQRAVGVGRSHDEDPSSERRN